VTIGLQHGQDVLTLSNIDDKIRALVRGLGCGYVPRTRIARELEAKELVVKETLDPVRRGMTFYQWNGEQQGRAMQWFLAQLADPSVRAELLS
jgi:DNA-binding transcriptional LysR family regulator